MPRTRDAAVVIVAQRVSTILHAHQIVVLEDGRTRVELVKAWRSSEEARAELAELRDRIKWQVFGWYSTGPAGALAPLIEQWPEQEKLTGMRVADLS